MPVNVPIKAGGNIYPARFVTFSTTANYTVVQSQLGDKKVLGITAEHTKDTPDSGGSSLAGASGDQIRVHFPGEDPLLELGSGGCTAGDYLKPDNDGKGITASTTNDVAFARAFETASAGEKVKVLVIDPYYVQ